LRQTLSKQKTNIEDGKFVGVVKFCIIQLDTYKEIPKTTRGCHDAWRGKAPSRWNPQDPTKARPTLMVSTKAYQSNPSKGAKKTRKKLSVIVHGTSTEHTSSTQKKTNLR